MLSASGLARSGSAGGGQTTRTRQPALSRGVYQRAQAAEPAATPQRGVCAGLCGRRQATLHYHALLPTWLSTSCLGKRPQDAAGIQCTVGACLDVANGIAFLHAQHPQVLHLDLKPPNVVILPLFPCVFSISFSLTYTHSVV